VAALAAFITEAMGWDETGGAATTKGKKEDESLDDFPF